MQKSLKIGIISDSHGWIHPNIVNLINTCDQIIHAGDIVEEQTLKILTRPLTAVRGNNDRHIKLKDIEVLSLPGGRIAIEHGHEHGWKSPSHESLRQTHPNIKVIVYGHTHKQVIDTKYSPWIVNPGASGVVRNGGSSKCLILNISNTQHWQITPYQFQ